MKQLLSSIQSPSDLKTLSLDELDSLSREIRKRIIEVMSLNGGHLASNLGTVELSIALHYCFHSPKDRLIFDVSHQCYTHKILTGRNQRFSTIRKHHGLSGFSDPRESPHDHFFAGHAGTALSLALGAAHTRTLTEEEYYILPILGDASLTCGLTFEALNNIPQDLSRFMLILNDNAMSIYNNVGAITEILNSQKAKQFFELFHLTYMGPIDGHHLPHLIEQLQRAKEKKGPILFHVKTSKGYGMESAVKDPIKYHGAKPFDLITEKFHPPSNTSATFPKIFGTEILQMAKQDASIVVVNPATPVGSCLVSMMKQYPNRCLDMGIAEGHAITYAGGMGHTHQLKVVCSIYATFLQRGFDNLFHDVCLQNIPAVFAIDRAGIAGGDGITHNGIYDIGFLASIPNLIICQPRDGHQLKELLHSAFEWQSPVAIRFPNQPTHCLGLPVAPRTAGKGEMLVEGEDVLIIALGTMCKTAFEVREILEKKGISVAIFDPVFLKPLDTIQLTNLYIRFRNIVTLEEHSIQSGLASIINSHILHNAISEMQVLNLGIPDKFVSHGMRNKLLEELELTATQIAERIKTHFSFERTECMKVEK